MNLMSRINKKAFYAFILVFIISGTLNAGLSRKFKNFLYSNAELISRLAHPTNDYVSSYVDDDDNLVIKNKCSMTNDYQILKIYISSDLDTFKVLRDDDFMPAFAATELLKELVIDIIKEIEENSRDSKSENKFIRKVLDEADNMNGKQLAHVIVVLKWIDYYASN